MMIALIIAIALTVISFFFRYSKIGIVLVVLAIAILLGASIAIYVDQQMLRWAPGILMPPRGIELV